LLSLLIPVVDRSQSAQNNASYVVEDGQSQKQAMQKLYIIYSYEEY